MRYFFFLIIMILCSCAKQKSVLICGDHECINKTEAKQYFEENLTIEVRVKDSGETSSFDLVDLNLENQEQKIKVIKNDKNKIVKKLSKEEIKIKKKQIKEKKNISKERDTKAKSKKLRKENKIDSIGTNSNLATLSDDICLKLEKCDIDSITKYLIKKSNEKDFPNISVRN